MGLEYGCPLFKYRTRANNNRTESHLICSACSHIGNSVRSLRCGQMSNDDQLAAQVANPVFDSSIGAFNPPGIIPNGQNTLDPKCLDCVQNSKGVYGCYVFCRRPCSDFESDVCFVIFIFCLSMRQGPPSFISSVVSMYYLDVLSSEYSQVPKLAQRRMWSTSDHQSPGLCRLSALCLIRSP